jgi:TatD DNase family protein
LLLLIDSHCHLDRLDLAKYAGAFERLMASTRAAGVDHMLSVCIDLESYPQMLALVEPYDQVSISVGVHPNEQDRREPDVEELVRLAQHPRNVAIGETGLDYFRSKGAPAWQHARFRTHIRAAREAGKPLIIHSRDAREDTIRILQEERADEVGGVMHCFTESWEMAQAAMAIGFSISFSGIVTFRNAEELRLVAAKVPADRLLIETDAPYLAPAPHRGKPNEPKYVAHVAEKLAEVRGVSVATLARQTRENYYRLFGRA